MAAAHKPSDPVSGGGEFGPWNPGIRSPVPEELRHCSTIYLPQNVFTSFRTASELVDFTGLDVAELVAFRPERLALHEVLIRVTADLSVPDGHKVEDLGINFREMTRIILGRYIEPHMHAIRASFVAMRTELAQLIEAELGTAMAPVRSDVPNARSISGSLFARFALRRKRTAPS